MKIYKYVYKINKDFWLKKIITRFVKESKDENL